MTKAGDLIPLTENDLATLDSFNKKAEEVEIAFHTIERQMTELNQEFWKIILALHPELKEFELQFLAKEKSLRVMYPKE